MGHPRRWEGLWIITIEKEEKGGGTGRTQLAEGLTSIPAAMKTLLSSITIIPPDR